MAERSLSMREVRGSIPCDSTFFAKMHTCVGFFFLDTFSVFGFHVTRDRAALSPSQVHAALVRGHHVLDVNEGVFTAMLLEELKGALDEVSQDHSLTLAILDLVSKVQVVALEEVKDGEDLSVVGYKGLSNSLRALDERLEDLKGHSDNLRVTGVKGSYE